MPAALLVRLWVVEWLQGSQVWLRVFDTKSEALALARSAPRDILRTLILWEL